MRPSPAEEWKRVDVICARGRSQLARTQRRAHQERPAEGLPRRQDEMHQGKARPRTRSKTFEIGTKFILSLLILTGYLSRSK